MKLISYKKIGFNKETLLDEYWVCVEGSFGTMEFLYQNPKGKDFIFDKSNKDLLAKIEKEDGDSSLSHEMFEKSRKEWDDLNENNPEEYKRRVDAMQPIIDRYNSEIGIFNDDNDEQ